MKVEDIHDKAKRAANTSKIYYETDIVAEGFGIRFDEVGTHANADLLKGLRKANFSKVFDLSDERGVVDISNDAEHFEIFRKSLVENNRLSDLKKKIDEMLTMYGDDQIIADEVQHVFKSFYPQWEHTKDRIVPESITEHQKKTLRNARIMNDIQEANLNSRELSKKYKTSLSTISQLRKRVRKGDFNEPVSSQAVRAIILPPRSQLKELVGRRYSRDGFVASNWFELITAIKQEFPYLQQYKDNSLEKQIRKVLGIRALQNNRKQYKPTFKDFMLKQTLVGFLTVNLLYGREKVLFFDQSSVVPGGFKSTSLGDNMLKPFRGHQYGMPNLNFLAAIDVLNGTTAVRVSKYSARSDDVVNFITEVITHLCSKTPKAEWGWHIVLDNAGYQKTAAFKNLVNKLPINIIYNVPSSPFLNLIEDFFLSVKHEFRDQYYTSRHQAIQSLSAGLRNTCQKGYAWIIRKFLRLMRDNIERMWEANRYVLLQMPG